MGTYRTFPKSPSESSALATRGTWLEMLHFRSFSLPLSRGETYLRIRTNAIYFAMDYGFIVLFIVSLCLLGHPISLIFFVVGRFYFYIVLDEPALIMGCANHALYVLIAHFIYSIVFLLLSGATMYILISFLIGVVVVLIHAVFWKNDDLFLDEDDLFLDKEAAGPGG